ncbi:MAG TPA: transposase [Planctomycetaceae bacterium]|nr:transposase [Planctomycetaceae bacterium]
MARGVNQQAQRRWRDRLRRFARSKVSVAEFCRREQVSEPSFYQWRKRLAAAADERPDALPPQPATFLPVQLTAVSGLQARFPNGATLTLPADDPALIRLSIAAIAEARTTRGDA